MQQFIWLESDTCIFHVFKYSIFLLLKWKYKKLTFISTQKNIVQRKSIISILKDRKQNITNLVYFRSWLNLVHSKKYEVWFAFFSKTLWKLSSTCVVSYIHIKKNWMDSWQYDYSKRKVFIVTLILDINCCNFFPGAYWKWIDGLFLQIFFVVSNFPFCHIWCCFKFVDDSWNLFTGKHSRNPLSSYFKYVFSICKK